MRSAPLGTPRTASRIRGSGCRRRAGARLLLAGYNTFEDGLGIIHYCRLGDVHTLSRTHPLSHLSSPSSRPQRARVCHGAAWPFKNGICLIVSNQTQKSGSNPAGWHNSSLSNTISGSSALVLARVKSKSPVTVQQKLRLTPWAV